MTRRTKEGQKYLKALGSRLRALRKERGYSSAEKFAYANDLNRVQYSRYETGADLRFTTLTKVLTAMDISLAEFFSEGFTEEE